MHRILSAVLSLLLAVVALAGPPIARFDAVPGAFVRGVVDVGVCAQSIDGIARVDFAGTDGAGMPLEDQPWAFMESTNPQTRVREWWVAINTDELAEGPLDLKAEVFAKDGSQRDLTLRLFVDRHAPMVLQATAGTLATVLKSAESMNVAGAARVQIQLAPGTYTWPDNSGYAGWDRWLEIVGAPNLTSIITNGGANPMQKWLRLSGVLLRQSVNASILAPRSAPYGNHLWLDGCALEGLGYLGAGKSTAPCVSAGDMLVWYTGCTVRNTASTGLGGPAIQLVRGCTGQDIGSDFLNVSTLAVNNTVRHMRFDGLVHPDVLQIEGPATSCDNMIIQGLKAYDVRAQGLTLRPELGCRGVALVDIEMWKGADPGQPPDPQYTSTPAGLTAGRDDHVIMRNIKGDFPWRLMPKPARFQMSGCEVRSPVLFEGVLASMWAAELVGNVVKP